MARRWKRLIARRLRRRPLYPFLLLATATLDVVAWSAFGDRGRASFTPLHYALDGLVVAQVGLLAVWCTSAVRGWQWRLAASTVAVLAAGYAIDRSVAPSPLAFAPLSTFFACLFLISLAACVAVRSALARSRAVRGAIRASRRRFSMGQVLMTMTLVALITPLAMRADWSLARQALPQSGFVFEAVLPAVCLLIVELVAPAWLAAALMAALVAGVAAVMNRLSGYGAWYSLGPYYGAVAATIVVWLLGVRFRGRTAPRPVKNERPAQPLRVVTPDNPPPAQDLAAPTPIDLHA